MTWPPRDNSIDLGGAWLVRPGADDRGVAERWWSVPADLKQWVPITLPGAWQKTLGTGFHGVAWLRRTITVPRRWLEHTDQHRLWLRFLAVATDVRAWVNGVEVGRHVGDYVPFQFELTDAIGEAGSVEIVLRVDEVAAAPRSSPNEPESGHITKGYHDVISIQHGGVWQPLCLARTGRLCVVPDGVWVLADPCRGEGAASSRLDVQSVRRWTMEFATAM